MNGTDGSDGTVGPIGPPGVIGHQGPRGLLKNKIDLSNNITIIHRIAWTTRSSR